VIRSKRFPAKRERSRRFFERFFKRFFSLNASFRKDSPSSRMLAIRWEFHRFGISTHSLWKARRT
jgi:hypothetical protein